MPRVRLRPARVQTARPGAALQTWPCLQGPSSEGATSAGSPLSPRRRCRSSTRAGTQQQAQPRPPRRWNGHRTSRCAIPPCTFCTTARRLFPVHVQNPGTTLHLPRLPGRTCPSAAGNLLLLTTPRRRMPTEACRLCLSGPQVRRTPHTPTSCQSRQPGTTVSCGRLRSSHTATAALLCILHSCAGDEA